MQLRYRYTGDVPREFPTLPGGPTLKPGEEIGLSEAVDHPDLEKIERPKSTADAPKEAK